ncbi:O-methyltransferase [Algoriphagus hitonicola]|uniref:Methyltransferase domain-containing protein n=1 Tax=Algoriphagus hitonicola TaxID=435880 RepID=A0A1I2TGR6_9BACT|nr:hypothetical protein [Algoriphagus hitonicola]SFG64085.1 hypothetical protein SAMN04487988_10621 [Algoriphagus hitonicola]
MGSFVKRLIKFRDNLIGLDKVDFYVNRRIESKSEFNLFRFRELKAIEFLRPYFPKGYVVNTVYSLSFQTIQHIANDIIINRPKSIVEFGSGISTVILSNIIAENEIDTKFFSIDNNKEWQRLIALDLKNVSLIHFDISEENEYSYNGKGKWYGIPKDHDLLNINFDLAIIDGPSGSLCKYSRYGSLNFLKFRLNSNGIIFLDDVDRNEDVFLLKEFEKSFDFALVETFGKYSRMAMTNEIYTAPS